MYSEYKLIYVPWSSWRHSQFWYVCPQLHKLLLIPAIQGQLWACSLRTLFWGPSQHVNMRSGLLDLPSGAEPVNDTRSNRFATICATKLIRLFRRIVRVRMWLMSLSHKSCSYNSGTRVSLYAVIKLSTSPLLGIVVRFFFKIIYFSKMFLYLPVVFLISIISILMIYVQKFGWIQYLESKICYDKKTRLSVC